MKPDSKPKLSRDKAVSSKHSTITKYFLKTESNPDLNLLRHIEHDRSDITDTSSPDPLVANCHQTDE